METCINSESPANGRSVERKDMVDSRNKGMRFELRTAKVWSRALGIKIKRRGHETGGSIPSDLEFEPSHSKWAVECKKNEKLFPAEQILSGKGLTLKIIKEYEEKYCGEPYFGRFILVIARNREEPMVVVPDFYGADLCMRIPHILVKRPSAIWHLIMFERDFLKRAKASFFATNIQAPGGDK